MSYDSSEQDILMAVFTRMLKATTTDGGVKRARGEKPPWWSEAELKPHEAAMFSHLNKWKHGEKVDKDSGVHPLVHLAWRALAIAYQETEGSVDPATPVCRWHGYPFDEHGMCTAPVVAGVSQKRAGWPNVTN